MRLLSSNRWGDSIYGKIHTNDGVNKRGFVTDRLGGSTDHHSNRNMGEGMSTEQSLPRNWESLHKFTDEELTKAQVSNRKLRAEIRSLRRKLEDANRGAENNAHALYHCSKRGHEDAEKAHKLKQALTNLLPFVITRQHLLTEPVEFYLAVEHARDVMKEITQN